MNILLERYVFGDSYTIGKLYIDGEYLCLTLEDKVREVRGKPVAAWKIKGSTAIPALTYKLIVDHSERFDKDLPHLLDVPGFLGVRIHGGNASSNTEGCLLLGLRWKGGDWISDSQAAMKLFMPRLKEALDTGKEVTITIKNKEGK